MAKIAKNAEVPPKKASGRKSVRQAEVREGLELLKSGKGEKVIAENDKEFLVVELDIEKVETVKKAEAALFNLRWRLNPKNKTTGGDEAEFERLFGAAGHGGLKVYGDEKRVMLAAISTYPKGTAKAKSAAKGTAKTPAKKPAAANRATVKKQTVSA